MDGMKRRKSAPKREPADLADDSAELEPGHLVDGQPLEDTLVSEGDFSGRVLSITARRSIFESVSFAGSVVRSTKLRDVRLIRCDLSNTVLRGLEATRVEFIDCRLTGIKAIECRMEDVLFDRCEGAYAQFRDGAIRRGEFRDSRFTDADLAATALEDSQWIRTALTKADLRGAKLTGADLRGAAIDGILVNAPDVYGAIVTPDQAMDLARLLGLVIR